MILFRIFNYPPPADPALWGVGEHTDYGLLTILLQDDAGGLEVKSHSRGVPAPPVEGSFKKETMVSLAQLGYSLGKDPGSWQTVVPEPESPEVATSPPTTPHPAGSAITGH